MFLTKSFTKSPAINWARCLLYVYPAAVYSTTRLSYPIFLRSYASQPSSATQQPEPPFPPTATTTTSPTKEKPPENAKTAKKPTPGNDGSAYWQMDKAIPRDPPKPAESHQSSGIAVESVEVKVADGVSLEGHRRHIVSSILDLFQGKANHQRLEMWNEDSVLESPLSKAVGKKQVEAQWFSMKSLYKDVRMLNHLVTRNDGEIDIQVETQYLAKGATVPSIVKSTVVIELDDQERIARVQDKWDGKISDSKFVEMLRKTVSSAAETFVKVPPKD